MSSFFRPSQHLFPVLSSVVTCFIGLFHKATRTCLVSHTKPICILLFKLKVSFFDLLLKWIKLNWVEAVCNSAWVCKWNYSSIVPHPPGICTFPTSVVLFGPRWFGSAQSSDKSHLKQIRWLDWIPISLTYND